jgi:peptidylprolyl isomerase
MIPHILILLLMTIVAFGAVVQDAAEGESGFGDITTPSGLRYRETEIGDGASPEEGQKVVVHYTGWLPDGTKFYSSVDRGEPYSFEIGVGEVIKGWDEGVMSMNIGGKRMLFIPPELGYGSRGAGNVIPPHAPLIFEVELLDIRK